jgi:hypothetical protein
LNPFKEAMPTKITSRILKQLNLPGLDEVLINKLSFSELQSLLLYVFNRKVARLNASSLFSDYRNNRLVQPSILDPGKFLELESGLFSLLPDGFLPVELSPVTSLGTSSLMGPVNQDIIISTIRNCEVVSDVTNVMALECARRRMELLRQDKRAITHVKLATAHRQMRTQPVTDKNHTAHFKIFALCTAGRDEGSDHFEQAALLEHAGFYFRIIEEILNPDRIKKKILRIFSYDEDKNAALMETVNTIIRLGKDIEPVIEKNSDYGKNYYHRLRFMIDLTGTNNQTYNLIDGGFTDWTRSLMKNNKERLMTSGIGTELMMKVFFH